MHLFFMVYPVYVVHILYQVIIVILRDRYYSMASTVSNTVFFVACVISYVPEELV